jgi:hypothetical protein
VFYCVKLKSGLYTVDRLTYQLSLIYLFIYCVVCLHFDSLHLVYMLRAVLLLELSTVLIFYSQFCRISSVSQR